MITFSFSIFAITRGILLLFRKFRPFNTLIGIYIFWFLYFISICITTLIRYNHLLPLSSKHITLLEWLIGIVIIILILVGAIKPLIAIELDMKNKVQYYTIFIDKNMAKIFFIFIVLGIFLKGVFPIATTIF